MHTKVKSIKFKKTVQNKNFKHHEFWKASIFCHSNTHLENIFNFFSQTCTKSHNFVILMDIQTEPIGLT